MKSSEEVQERISSFFEKTERVCAIRLNVTERHVTVCLSCLDEAFSKIVWHMLSLVASTFLFTKLKYGDVGNCGLFAKSGVAVKIYILLKNSV